MAEPCCSHSFSGASTTAAKCNLFSEYACEVDLPDKSRDLIGLDEQLDKKSWDLAVLELEQTATANGLHSLTVNSPALRNVLDGSSVTS